jgi:XTP/dITP diphosphohydrolase
VIEVVEGVCEGKVTLNKRGERGFGYDPIFVPLGYNQTFAELGSEIKNKISHRAKALGMIMKLILS